MVQPGLEPVGQSAPSAEIAREASIGSPDATGPAAPELGVRVPPKPVVRVLPTAPGPRHPWGIVARCLALSALLGMAFVYFGQFSINADWVTGFLDRNELEMPRRMLLIVSGIAGAVLFVGVASVMLGRAWLARFPLARVERWLWVISPLIVLPTLPLAFDARAWAGHHQVLLTVLVPVLFTIEVLVTRSVLALADERPRWPKIAARSTALWRKHAPLLVVALAAAGYAVFVGYYLVRWHLELQTHTFDLSVENNLMYGGLKGVFGRVSVSQGADMPNAVAGSGEYGAYLLLPVYALVPRAETLLVAQSAFVGLTALPLFGFARRFVSPWTSAIVALAYLAYYPMHAASFGDPTLLEAGAFFVVVAAWAAERKRWIWLWLAFAFGAAMHANASIGFGVLGLVLLLTGHRPKSGAVIAALSALWFVIVHFAIVHRGGDWWFSGAYRELSGAGERGFGNVFATVVLNPLYLLDQIIEKDKVAYVLHLMVPLAFLPVRRWWLWAAFVPGAIVTLLVSSYAPATELSSRYVFFWIPYLFLAVPLALASIRERSEHGVAHLRGAVAALAFSSVVLSYNYGVFARREGSVKAGNEAISFLVTPRQVQRYSELRAAIGAIPGAASVSATDNVGPHVSARLRVYALRYGTFNADYLLAGRTELALGETRKVLRAALDSAYGVARRSGEFVLLKRGSDKKDNAALVKDWKL